MTACTCIRKPGEFTYVDRSTNTCVRCGGRVTERSEPKALGVQEGGDHYKGYAIQPFEFVRRNNVPHAEGECIYKLLRWRDKGGVADLRKVIHTVQLIIEEEEKKHGNEPV